MKFILGCDCEGEHLKEIIKEDLVRHGYDVTDLAETPAADFIEAVKETVRNVYREDDCFGIIIDGYGAGSFMTACRMKGVVAAEVSDERTAYMTRSHNNARILTIGAKITGEELAKNIVHGFAEGSYAGGHHQIRVDMLNAMGKPLEDRV